MKKNLLLLSVLLIGAIYGLNAQLPDYVIDDFEGDLKTYLLPFGGEISIVADPLDGSNNVLMYERPGNEVYGGVWARKVDGAIDSIPVGPNADQYRYGVARMLKSKLGMTRMKLEGGIDGAVSVENNPTTAPWRVGEWQTFIFDFGVKNQDGKTPGGWYKTVGLMPDRSPSQADSIVTYIDYIYFTQNKPILSFTEQIVGGYGIKHRTSESLSISWSELDRAVGYDIYVDDTYLTSTLSDVTFYEFMSGDLEAGKEYKFTIIAKDVDGVETVPVSVTTALRTKKNDWELIDDFEGPSLPYTVWKLDQFAYPVANPAPDDVNPSPNVLQARRPVGTGEQYPKGNSYGVVASAKDYDIAPIGWGSEAYHYLHVKMWRPITHGKPSVKFAFADGSSGKTDSIVAMPEQDSIWFNYVFVLDSLGEYKEMVKYELVPDNAFDDITTAEETRMYYIDDIILCKNVELNTDISAMVTFIVTDGTTPIQGAAVSFNDLYYGTNASGEVSFTGLPAGTYEYIISKDGYFETTGSVTIVDGDIQEEIVLNLDNTAVFENEQGDTRVYTFDKTLKLEVNTPGIVSLEVFDIAGRKVSTLVHDNWLPAGRYSYNLNLPKGIYIVKNGINTDYIFTKVLIK